MTKMSLSAGTNAAVIKAILMADADKNPLPNYIVASTVSVAEVIESCFLSDGP